MAAGAPRVGGGDHPMPRDRSLVAESACDARSRAEPTIVTGRVRP